MTKRATLHFSTCSKIKFFATIVTGFICDRFDPLQTFDPPFYISGITIFLSGIMLFFVPPLQRYLQKRRHDEVSETEKC